MDTGPLLQGLLEAECRFVVVGSTALVSAEPSVTPRDLDVVIDDARDNLARVARALSRLDGVVESTGGILGVGDVDLRRLPMWTVHTSRGDVDVILRFADGTGFHDLADRSSPAAGGWLRSIDAHRE